ncbi:MAG: substrate-binding domain-containing protein [Bryobacteraceae bacterium]|nr:substrate-binding domain-containing protein [Bryobacteraceae bacterium]
MRLFCVLVLLVFSSCRPAPKRVIGVVPKGANHIFWLTVRAGAEKAAAECGAEVEWNAPSLEVDASRQMEIVESMVNRRLAGIALAPVDRRALVRVVDRAANLGIPVAIFDSAIDTTRRLTYVATNNEEGGRMAARRLAASIGEHGQVGIIGFMPGSAATEERERGFANEMREKYPRIEVVGLRFAMADRAKALALTENMLTAYPALAGLFADNESSTAGAVQALKIRGANQVKLVAFDASEALVEDLRKNWIDALVVQNPFLMGYESTRAICRKLEGGTPAAEFDSGAKLVTALDLGKPEIQALLFPKINAR